MPKNRVKQRLPEYRTALRPLPLLCSLLVLFSLRAWAEPPIEPPDYYCQSGIRDSSGQCCAVGESVVDGVCTLVVTPPGGGIDGFCENPGNWDAQICGGGGGDDGGDGDDGGGGGAGDGDGDDSYDDSVIDDFLSRFPRWAKLTDAEKQFIRDNPLTALAFGLDAEDAEVGAARLFPTGGHNDDHDAFRHALWNALMAYSHGSGLALEFSSAHENYPENPAGEMAMDLHNNAIGAQIGAMMAHLGQSGTLDALSNEVYAALQNDQLITSPP